MSTQNTATALTTSTLTKAQQIQILINKEVAAEEAKQTVATATLSASQKGATASTIGLGAAFKGLGGNTKVLHKYHCLERYSWSTFVF